MGPGQVASCEFQEGVLNLVEKNIASNRYDLYYDHNDYMITKINDCIKSVFSSIFLNIPLETFLIKSITFNDKIDKR